MWEKRLRFGSSPILKFKLQKATDCRSYTYDFEILVSHVYADNWGMDMFVINCCQASRFQITQVLDLEVQFNCNIYVELNFQGVPKVPDMFKMIIRKS